MTEDHVALLFAGGMNLFSYWNADKIVLKMYKAQPVDEQHPNAVVRNYVADVRQMASDAGMPQPQVTGRWWRRQRRSEDYGRWRRRWAGRWG